MQLWDVIQRGPTYPLPRMPNGHMLTDYSTISLPVYCHWYSQILISSITTGIFPVVDPSKPHPSPFHHSLAPYPWLPWIGLHFNIFDILRIFQECVKKCVFLFFSGVSIHVLWKLLVACVLQFFHIFAGFLPVFESGLGKSPNINLNRLIYTLRSINVCLIYFEALFSAYKLIILSIYNVTLCV